MAALGLATGPRKLKAVTELVDKLDKNFNQEDALPLKDRLLSLEELKIYSRQPQNSDPIYSQKGVGVLVRYAFDYPSAEANLGGLRVLANVLLLRPDTRQIVIDLGSAPKICRDLQTESWEHGFLLSRVLLLLTYDTTLDMKVLIDEHKLAERMIGQMARHANQLSQKSKGKEDPMQNMALVETTRVLFNITHHAADPEHISAFTPVVPHVVALFMAQDPEVTPASKPLDGPIGPLINVLLNLDAKAETSQEALYPSHDPNSVVSKLKDLLFLSLNRYTDNELDTALSGLVGFTRIAYAYAPDETKEVMRSWFLPTDADREEVLGKGDTLSAKLLKASVNPLAPGMRKSISELLYECSDLDASKFIENVGFGTAIGYLVQNNIPIPPSYSEEFAKTHPAGGSKAVNPITGQFIDSEKPVEVPEMTEEEKEREAERLFVLFERLKKTGIIDVQNPVEAAMNQGRFRELKDDEVEELD